MKTPLRDIGIRQGFTLVELLVVVAIIAVLLSLLTPALDRAIYQVELAICMARFDGIGMAMATYAMANKRFYVSRYSMRTATAGRANLLNAGPLPADPAFDDRPLLEKAFDLDILVDPLSPKISFKKADNPGDPFCYTSTPLWAGWQQIGQRGMVKLGDRLISGNNFDSTDTKVYHFNVLAADLDQIANTLNEFRTAHPDHEGLEWVYKFENESAYGLPSDTVATNFTNSQWVANAGRGKVDQNYLFDDGAVLRYNNVEPQDDRMKAIPYTNAATAGQSLYIPAAGTGR